MKVVGIGDLLIPEQYIKEGFKEFEKNGHTVQTIQWNLKNYEELQNINLLIETKGSEAYQPPEEIIKVIKDADIIITQFCPITQKMIGEAKNLKIIGVLRGGYENVNVSYATQKGIVVCNTPGRNANAVADFTVGMLLAECRNIARSHKNLKDGKWVRDYNNKDQVPDLSGRSVGIIGFGEIGQKVAKRLQGFDMKILVYDPYVEQVPEYVKSVSLVELMRGAQFVTLHSRLTKQTEHMINKEMLSYMRKDAYLINTARSGLVDEEALYEILKNKQIAGAAIDVFDKEPPGKEYPLVNLDNVTITPHLAGGTTNAFLNSPKIHAKEMLRILDGKKSRYQVNAVVLKKLDV